MHQIKYRVENLSPLVLSASVGDMNMVATERYLAGTAMLGVLAKRIIEKKGLGSDAHLDEQFHRWLLEGNLSVGAAFGISKDPDSGDTEHTFFPPPLSIQKEKHGYDAYDLLLVDDDFDAQTVALGKFVAYEEDELVEKEVATSLNFHHGRDRRKGIPAEGVIFNYESICPGQVFEGVVRGSEQDLSELVEICGRSWTAHAGRSKTAQYGHVAFSFQDEGPEPLEFEENWDEWVVLRFLSDGIVRNPFGFASTELKDLERYLGGAKVVKSVARKREVENFVGVWRMKTPSEQCFRAGSSFLVDLSSCDASLPARWMENGLGERTGEGFGRCLVTEYEDENVETRAYERPEPQRPGGKAPKQVLAILAALAAEGFEKAASLAGSEDQGRFRRIPTKSLISRLAAMAEAMTAADFAKAVAKLRKSAKDKLERCFEDKTGQSLYDFLQTQAYSVETALKEPRNSHVAEIRDEILKQSGEQLAFDQERLRRLYWISFFSTMRKKSKNGRG